MNTIADANAAKAALDKARSLVTESAPDPSPVDRIQRVDVTVDDGEDGWGISGADRARHAARSVSLYIYYLRTTLYFNLCMGNWTDVVFIYRYPFAFRPACEAHAGSQAGDPPVRDRGAIVRGVAPRRRADDVVARGEGGADRGEEGRRVRGAGRIGSKNKKPTRPRYK